MLNTSDKIIKHKTGLLNLAEERGIVSMACQVMGMSGRAQIVPCTTGILLRPEFWFPALPCPALPCPALPCPALPCFR